MKQVFPRHLFPAACFSDNTWCHNGAPIHLPGQRRLPVLAVSQQRVINRGLNEQFCEHFVWLTWRTSAHSGHGWSGRKKWKEQNKSENYTEPLLWSLWWNFLPVRPPRTNNTPTHTARKQPPWERRSRRWERNDPTAEDFEKIKNQDALEKKPSNTFNQQVIKARLIY